MSGPNPFSSGFVAQVDSITPIGNPVTAASRYCEACDRDFTSQKDFEAHIAAHVPCPVPGCNYRGAKRAVNIHVDEAHVSSKAPLVTDSAEDIARWIAERKKSWPSKQNIERREEERKAKAAEVAATGGLKRKREGEESGRPSKPCRKFAAGKCTFGDKCRFSHDPEDASQSKQTKRPCRNFANGKCKFGNKCKFGHGDGNKPGAKGTSVQKKKGKPSLLTKLLSSEIETEKILVLQCLKFITSNNFFLEM